MSYNDYMIKYFIVLHNEKEYKAIKAIKASILHLSSHSKYCTLRLVASAQVSLHPDARGNGYPCNGQHLFSQSLHHTNHEKDAYSSYGSGRCGRG